MRILIYGINFPPDQIGIAKYTGEMAGWLAKCGHELRVVTAPPYYPAWRVTDGYSSGRYQRERWRGVALWRCPMWVPHEPSGVKRILHLASFAISSFPIMVRQILWRPDLMFVIEPTLFCAPAALGLSRLVGARSWLHAQDYEVDAAFELGLIKGKVLRRLVAASENWLMRRFDRVSTISSRMLDRARAKGVAAERLVLFPNWVDTEMIRPLEGISPFRAELGIPADAVVALYSGNMGRKQGLETLAEAAGLLQQVRGLYFVFCGSGAGRLELEAQCEGLPNVQFIDLQPLERLNDLLGMADINMLPQRANAADLVMPSKLSGMLASGRSIVAGARADTEIARVLEGRGLVVPPEDPAAFAKAILVLAQDKDVRQRLGASARRFAEEELGCDHVLSRFLDQIQDK
jgi:colanic acid biosynthesis glycosyl transferase WcaI